MADVRSLEGFADAVAAASAAPAGGAVAAVTASLAASLTAMVGRLALAKAGAEAPPSITSLIESSDQLRARLLELAGEDESAFRAVVEARRTGDQLATQAAWRRAARVPADVVRLSREVTQLARRAAREGPPSTLGDAAMAAMLAAAAGAGSQVNLRLNVQAAGRPEELRVLADSSEIQLREAQRAAVETRQLVEERLRG
jgi:formiminotetrahydrofolate cyclodeaminase